MKKSVIQCEAKSLLKRRGFTYNVFTDSWKRYVGVCWDLQIISEISHEIVSNEPLGVLRDLGIYKS